MCARTMQGRVKISDHQPCSWRSTSLKTLDGEVGTIMVGANHSLKSKNGHIGKIMVGAKVFRKADLQGQDWV